MGLPEHLYFILPTYVMARKVLTPEVLVKALSLKYDGKTYDEIAKELGYSRTTFVRWLPIFEEAVLEIYRHAKIEGASKRVKVKDKDVFEKLNAIQNELENVKSMVSELENIKAMIQDLNGTVEELKKIVVGKQ